MITLLADFGKVVYLSIFVNILLTFYSLYKDFLKHLFVL